MTDRDRAERASMALKRAMLWNGPEKFTEHFYASEKDSENMAAMDLAVVAVTGSWNYNLQTEDSDVDLKAAYWPQFHQFYDGKFPHVSMQMVKYAAGEFDLTLSPVHELLNHVLKGNIGWVEMLYPRKDEYLWLTTSELDYCVSRLRALARMNVKRSVMSSLGHARDKMGRLHKYTPSTEGQEEKYGYNLKEASHAVRWVSVMTHLLQTGDFDFVNHVNMDMVQAIKHGQFDEFEARKAWAHAENELLSLVTTDPDARLQESWTKLVEKKDRTHTKPYADERELFERHLREAVENHLR